MKKAISLLVLFLLVPQIASAVISKEKAIKPLSADSIIEKVNEERVKYNLPVFVVDKKLNEAARLKAENLAKRGIIEHTTSSKGSLWWPLESVKYSYDYAGENLAVDMDEAKDIVLSWMSSPSHRANILNKNYVDTGMAVSKGIFDGKESYFVVQYLAKKKPSVQVKSQIQMQSSVNSLNLNTSDKLKEELMIQLISLLQQYMKLLSGRV